MRVLAPAKLTVSLRIVGLRDDGYHLIDAEMVSLDLCDVLEISDGDGLEVVGDAPEGGNNIVVGVLAELDRTAFVRLEKHVPTEAGLGGGSTDAGAVLWWAGVDDPALAAGFGADVPFCVRGGRARVTGVGEIVSPLPYEEAVFTLVMPPFGCNTHAVYRVWDLLAGPTGEHGNDLEPAAVDLEPRMAEWRERIGEATGLVPRLAGSGSTWFVEGAFPDLDLPGARVVVARAVPGRETTAPKGGR